MRKYMICFDEIETGLCVNYKDDIPIGSLLEQIDCLIKEYPNKRLWLKLIEDKCMNADNTTKAVEGLDIFMKNWCMNCSKTNEQHDLIFRCKECEFKISDDKCLVKIFAHKHKHDYPIGKFGSMVGH